MTIFELTDNELRAAIAIVTDCLDGMGGARPIDLDDDPFTWTSADVLIARGWTRHGAAGTIGALLDKGVLEDYSDDLVLTDAAYRWLDTVWDAYQARADR